MHKLYTFYIIMKKKLKIKQSFKQNFILLTNILKVYKKY